MCGNEEKSGLGHTCTPTIAPAMMMTVIINASR
jgi:hypothetical protein